MAEPPKDLVRVEPMLLPKAQEVLKTIVATSENTFTSLESLASIGGYTLPQIREAEAVVARSVLGSNQQKIKQTPSGELVELKTEHDWLFFFSVSDSRGLALLGFELALQNPSPNAPHAARFDDFRHGSFNSVRLSLFDREPNLADFRQLVRGLRMMSANLLDWDTPGVIMPKDLDTKLLPGASAET